MRNRKSKTNVVNLKKKRLEKKYKALFRFLTNIKTCIKSRCSEPNILKNYEKTMNH